MRKAPRSAALDSSLRWNDEYKTSVTPGSEAVPQEHLIWGQAYSDAALNLALPRLVGRGDEAIGMLGVEI